ncbi:hypothetical protein TFLX_03231 [Thermoflexales bacterium]|nr:hypothetical protein TFLX_03231 [Thermoflexales bacterium]
MKQYTIFQKKVNQFVMDVTMNLLHLGLMWPESLTHDTLWRFKCFQKRSWVEAPREPHCGSALRRKMSEDVVRRGLLVGRLWQTTLKQRAC